MYRTAKIFININKVNIYDRAMDEEVEEPGTGEATTPAAISYTIGDEEFIFETTTASAITSASEITINITTYGDEEVVVTNSSSAEEESSLITVTTSSAIDGQVEYEINVELKFTENIIVITVGDKEYILTVNKEESAE